MEYKGYLASVEFDDEAEIFHGEVVNTPAVITFQAASANRLQREMEESIEDYLEWCTERGKEPETPSPDHLLVRATPELQQAVVAAASRAQQSLDAWLMRVLQQATGLYESRATLG